MIINLHFNEFRKNRCVPETLFVMLERDVAYEMSVNHIHIELKSNQISKDNELWCLSTNLIDRSTSNPLQAVSYFTLARGKLNYNVTHGPVASYPLDVHQLENTEFLFRRVTKEKILNIQQAFVQIEIKRCLESARV